MAMSHVSEKMAGQTAGHSGEHTAERAGGNDHAVVRDQRPADADARNWVDRFAPPKSRPYLRLMRADRPVGVWLLLLPCWFGLALAAATGVRDVPFIYYAILFAVGAFVMRSAGCAYNDIVDRDIDAKVARTALRPIPAGQISIRSAWICLIALSLTGLAVLLQFNPFTIFLGFASLALVAGYPFMKRITWWPQVWLGLTFNWGVLVGFAAATGALTAPAILAYSACVLWTIGYDTIYAHQDKEDDALIGVKSTAIRLGDRTRPAVALFYGGVITLMAAAGAAAALSPVFFLALAAPAAHFIWQIKRLDVSDGGLCLALFKSNQTAAFLLLAPFLLAALVPSP